jgi:hypothetical protein
VLVRHRTNFAMPQRRVTAVHGCCGWCASIRLATCCSTCCAPATRISPGPPVATRRARLAELACARPSYRCARRPPSWGRPAPGWPTVRRRHRRRGRQAPRRPLRAEPAGLAEIATRSETEAVVGGVTGTVSEPQTLLLAGGGLDPPWSRCARRPARCRPAGWAAGTSGTGQRHRRRSRQRHCCRRPSSCSPAPAGTRRRPAIPPLGGRQRN